MTSRPPGGWEDSDEKPPRQLHDPPRFSADDIRKLHVEIKAARQSQALPHCPTQHELRRWETERREEQRQQQAHRKYLRERSATEAATEELWRRLQMGEEADLRQAWKDAPDEVRAEVMRRAAGGPFKQPRPRIRKG